MCVSEALLFCPICCCWCCFLFFFCFPLLLPFFCVLVLFLQMPRPCALPCHSPGEHGLSKTGRHHGLHRLPPIRRRAVRPAHDRPTTRGHRVSSVVNFPSNAVTRVIRDNNPPRANVNAAFTYDGGSTNTEQRVCGKFRRSLSKAAIFSCVSPP